MAEVGRGESVCGCSECSSAGRGRKREGARDGEEERERGRERKKALLYPAKILYFAKGLYAVDSELPGHACLW